MAALRQTIRDEAFKEAAESFAYTTAVPHPDWDLSYLGNHLATQVAEWRTELQADQLPVEERPAEAASPAGEIQEALPPFPDGLPQQVIEGDQEPVIRPVESDASIEQIDNPNGL